MRTSLAVGVAALILLSGCDWLGIGSSTPTSSENARPGAERQIGATNSLPAARAAGGYDASFAPVDETRDAPRIGSVVQGKGGQKAQKEAAEKDSIEREAREREERARQQREADLKKAQADKSADKSAGKPTKPGDTMTPAAPSTDAVPPPPVPPPPAPVTAAPLSPPPASTPPAAPAAPSSDTKQ
ncbi:MAG: hypothetical protein JSS04_20895 [Proteobacteria bacterium]|nr:hypothetical protein [Pseudomonadota bacterium]